MSAVLARTERAQRFYAAAAELHNIGNDVYQKSQEDVPVGETGNLKSSGHISNMIRGPVAISEIGYGGASAIGIALKLVRAATGRFKTISLWDSFHGASLDTISIGGESAFRQNAGPLLPGCEHAPPPDPSPCNSE